MKTPLLCMMLALFCSSWAVAANNWYISTTGSDSNNCNSVSTACATFNHVDAIAAGGDTVHVQAGTYNLTGSSGAQPCIITNTSGVTWQADTFLAAKINGQGLCGVIWSQSSGARGGLTITGFDITGTLNDSGLHNRALGLDGGNGGDVVSYNWFHDMGSTSATNNILAAVEIDPFASNAYTGNHCSMHHNILSNISANANFSSTGYGVYLVCGAVDGTNPDFSHNLLVNVGSIGLQTWHYANNWNITGNTIDNSYIGILAGTGDSGGVASAFFDIEDNHISNSRAWGLEFEDQCGASPSYCIAATSIVKNTEYFASASGDDTRYAKNGTILSTCSVFVCSDNITGH